MLSKKMAVSLTSLIIICALALIASPALSANKITLSVFDTDYNGTLATDSGDDTDKKGDRSTKSGTQTFTADVVVIEAKAAMDLNTASLSLGDTTTPGDIRILQGNTVVVPTGSVWVDGKTFRFTVPAQTILAGGDPASSIIHVLPGALETLATGASDSIGASITIQHIAEDSTGTAIALGGGTTTQSAGEPVVLAIFRSDMATHPIFEDSVTFTIVLSEEPQAFTVKDHIEVKEAAISSLHAVGTRDLLSATNGAPGGVDEVHTGNEGGTAGATGPVYLYALTLAPKFEKSDAIQIRIKKFKDLFGVEAATGDYALDFVPFQIAASRVVPAIGKPGLEVKIPNDLIIRAGGSLIVAKNDGDGTDTETKTDSTFIDYPGMATDTAAMMDLRKPNRRDYNLIEADLPDLETFLTNGGTIDLIAEKADHTVKITEIMWATDAGNANRQWIEIMHIPEPAADAAATTAAAAADIKTKDYKLMFYSGAESRDLPDMTAADSLIVDRVGTLYMGVTYWPTGLAGKGQSGNTSGTIDTGVDVEITPTVQLVSMVRVGADGTMATSWAQSMPPSLNFTDAAKGLLLGTPGTIHGEPPTSTDDETDTEDMMDAAAAMTDDIKITEIMVDTGNGRLPQWIELTNVSGKEVSLDDWSVMISNSAADTDVVGATVTISLKGRTLGVGGGEDAGGTMGKSLLLVAGPGRSSSNLAEAKHEPIFDVSDLVGEKGRYTLLSPMGFMIALIPPQETGVLTYGDTAGNLGAAEAWDIPMSENGRSSLIRRETLADGTATMGTAVNGWVLASGTDLVSGPQTWYGSPEDDGTPGYDAGGPLPVELSHFRPARDKATGAVVITWATQSELNNAGFFIKRSNQKDGEFKVINATMIAGAGTTSEKQFYTYTDTTAQPNVVYYYQIEDVSLDGNRQTLTRGIRLKGHIGAAGKLTTTWGDLKTSNE